MKDEIERRRADAPTRIFETDPQYYDDRAAGLVSAHAAGVPQALAQIRRWHPARHDRSDEELRGLPFGQDDARLVYARQHGFASWEALVDGVRAVAAGTRREPFRDAFEALRARRWDVLAGLLRAHPDLARARGTNGNTLLNLAGSLAGPGACQPPGQLERVLSLLLDAGADVNAANDRGWTPLHQAGYSNQPEAAGQLLEAGADPAREAHGDGGTPLAAALFWGHQEVSAVLAGVLVVPDNLRIASGLGRLDLVEACFDEDGRLNPLARAGRGFYRPHSGFPVWTPSDAAGEVLDEALVWAAKANRVEVMPALVARGAEVNGHPYRGTPLIWAAANDRREAARWLLDHGATITPTAFGGSAHGEGVTALHLAAQNDHAEMVRMLLDRGGDPAATDLLYHSTPLGWADHSQATRAAEVLRLSC